MNTGTVRDRFLQLACSLNAPAEIARRRTTLKALHESVREVRELPMGYALRYPGEESWIARLADFIALERRCCPFLSFDLKFEPHGGPIWMYVQGPKGVKEFIEAEIASAEAGSE